MASVLNKHPRAAIFSYVTAYGVKDLTILPDLNIDVDQKAIDALTGNPIWDARVIDGEFVIFPDVKEIEVIGQKEGNDYTDIEGQEEVLVTSQKEIGGNYSPDKATLLRYSGVASKTADKILALAPKGGWASKADFYAATKEFNIDWSKDGLKANK
jgi:hypothetical protein